MAEITKQDYGDAAAACGVEIEFRGHERAPRKGPQFTSSWCPIHDLAENHHLISRCRMQIEVMETEAIARADGCARWERSPNLAEAVFWAAVAKGRRRDIGS